MFEELFKTVAEWEQNPLAKWVLIIVGVLAAFGISLLLVRLLIDFYWPLMILLFIVCCVSLDDVKQQAGIQGQEVPISIVLGSLAFVIPMIFFPLSGLHVLNEENTARRLQTTCLNEEVVALRTRITTLENRIQALEKKLEKPT